MRSSRRFRDRQKGQCSVEYSLLVGLVVLMIVVFAQEYQLSVRGVAHSAMSTLSAATQTLPAGADHAPAAGDSPARGWGNEPSLTPRSLGEKVKHSFK